LVELIPLIAGPPLILFTNLKKRKMKKTTWVLDPAHSEISFKIKHLMISNVNGKFGKFTATAESENENDFRNATLSFEAETASIDTGNEQRDNHLRSAEFFDAEKFPKVSFVSTKTEMVGESKYYIHGDLTMHGVTKPISFEAEYSGMAKDPWGNTKAGFEFHGKLNRKDFGLNWNAALEAGGVMVSDEVKIHGEIQLVKQA
jgi:polyisoprenoid-binding protein YceI